ncbi:MAG: hypothetical protein Fur0018_16250 [Anaerolineales bacterium]
MRLFHFRSLFLLMFILALSGLLTLAPAFAGSRVTTQVYLPLIAKNFQSGPAVISGIVYDATIGKQNGALAGAQVCIQNTTNCEITDVDGTYSLGGINNGLQTIVVSKTGYSTLTRQINAQYYDGSQQSITVVDLALSINNLGSNQYRIVLSWSPARPVDLDANLWVPPDGYQVANSSGTGTGSCSTSPWACIDIDSVDGNAPESITIAQAQPGTYIYAVRHYDFASGTTNNKPPLSQTSAHVDVYDNSGLIASYDVPSSSDDFAVWWHVFDMDGATGAITTINTINSANPAGGIYP